MSQIRNSVHSAATVHAWLRDLLGGRRGKRPLTRREANALLEAMDYCSLESRALLTRIRMLNELLNVCEVSIERLRDLAQPGSTVSDHLARAMGCLHDGRRAEAANDAALLASAATALGILRGGPGQGKKVKSKGPEVSTVVINPDIARWRRK